MGHSFSLHYGKLLKDFKEVKPAVSNLGSNTLLNVKLNCSAADSNLISPIA